MNERVLFGHDRREQQAFCYGNCVQVPQCYDGRMDVGLNLFTVGEFFSCTYRHWERGNNLAAYSQGHARSRVSLGI